MNDLIEKMIDVYGKYFKHLLHIVFLKFWYIEIYNVR